MEKHDHNFTNSLYEVMDSKTKELTQATFGCACGESVKVAIGSRLYKELKSEYERTHTKTGKSRSAKPRKRSAK